MQTASTPTESVQTKTTASNAPGAGGAGASEEAWRQGRNMHQPPRSLWEQINSVRRFLKDPLGFLYEVTMDYGRLYYLVSRWNRLYFVTEPAVIQHILQKNPANYTKSERYGEVKRLLGEGLLTSEGDFWRRQRRIASPAFHKKKIQKLADDMYACTQDTVERWGAAADNQQPVDALREMMRLTLDVVGRTLLSQPLAGASAQVFRSFSVANELVSRRVSRPFNFPYEWPLPENRKLAKAIRELDELIRGLVRQRMALPEAERPTDLLTMLIETRDADTGEGMNETQLRDEVMTIFLAGHETSANALTWTLYLLLEHPEYLHRLQAEIDEHLTPGQQPPMDTLIQMPLLNQVLQEGMRLYPPAWVFERQSIDRDVAAGYRIEANTPIAITPYVLHRHPDFWEKPHAFWPERFAPENSEGRHKFAYLPFGNGPRVCIGNHFAMLEMQLILSTLLQQFDLQRSTAGPIQPEALITLRPKNGMPVRVKRRQPA